MRVAEFGEALVLQLPYPGQMDQGVQMLGRQCSTEALGAEQVLDIEATGREQSFGEDIETLVRRSSPRELKERRRPAGPRSEVVAVDDLDDARVETALDGDAGTAEGWSADPGSGGLCPPVADTHRHGAQVGQRT